MLRLGRLIKPKKETMIQVPINFNSNVYFLGYLDFSFLKLFTYHAHLFTKFTSARLEVIFCLRWCACVYVCNITKKLSTNFDEIFEIAQQFFEEHCGGDQITIWMKEVVCNIPEQICNAWHA